VVQGATSVQVLMYDGTTYDATVVNYSEPDDLAVLKVDAKGLHALPIGNSDQVLVGDDVVVIGNPAGLEYGWSTTNGIISAINREVTIKDNDGAVSKKMTLLQTNANVNSGNSGGPMFNEKGEVIGIISLKLANGYEGMGFAIPINGAMEIMNAIIEDGSADHVDSSVSKKPPMLGVTGAGVREGFALVFYDDGTYWHGPENLLPDDVQEKVYHISHNGFFVLTTAEHSDANGKLQEGDIIVAIDGVQTSSRSAVIAVLSQKSAGDVVRLA
jgi:serine protease Do